MRTGLDHTGDGARYTVPSQLLCPRCAGVAASEVQWISRRTRCLREWLGVYQPNVNSQCDVCVELMLCVPQCDKLIEYGFQAGQVEVTEGGGHADQVEMCPCILRLGPALAPGRSIIIIVDLGTAALEPSALPPVLETEGDFRRELACSFHGGTGILEERGSL